MSETMKILILVGSVIVVCVLCAVGFKITNQGRSSANSGTEIFNKSVSQYNDIDVSIYDDSMITGSELVRLVKNTIEKSEYLSVEVYTLDGTTLSYNYIYDRDEQILTDRGPQGQTADKEVPDNKYEIGYINQMAVFSGEVYEDMNGNKVCIRFEQQP